MRLSRAFALSILLGTFIVWPATAPLKAQNSARWIVLGSDASANFSRNLSALDAGSGRMSSGITTMQIVDGRTVAALDPILEGLMQRVIHTAHHRCGGYTVHPTLEAAEAEARNPFYEQGAIDRMSVFPRTIDQQAVVRPALNRVDKTQIVSTIQKLQGFGTRYYQSENGQNAALEMMRQWGSYGSGRADFSVRLQRHNFRQNSVIATLRGTEIPDEIVVIGGHLDSINSFNADAAPVLPTA
jgi:leucyl aminopeptidase